MATFATNEMTILNILMVGRFACLGFLVSRKRQRRKSLIATQQYQARNGISGLRTVDHQLPIRQLIR